MARPGRPRKTIDLKEAERLCALQCSEQEIADWFHVSVDTLDRRIHEERQCGFAEFFAKHRVQGKMALRRNLFKLSATHPAAAIFLAKNWLSMADKVENLYVGDEKRPVVIKGVDSETKKLIGEVMHGKGTDGTADNADI